MPKILKSRPTRTIRKLFKGTKTVPIGTDKYLKQYRLIEMASHRAKMRRATLRKTIGKGRISALGYPGYRKLTGKQVKRYAKEVARDFKHPIKSFKRQTRMVRYHINPITGRVTKRSPAGIAATSGVLFGLPAYYGITEFTGKESKKRPFGEKLTRSLSMTLPMMSPRAIPSVTAYQIPELVFKKKKKKRINLSAIPIDELLRMK